MKKISLMIMVLVVALASCKKTPEVNLKYVDVERDLVTVGTTTANIQCDYVYIATLKKAYLFYGESENEADMTSAEMRVVQNTLYVELTGLKENTAYSYYYEFHNGFNSMRAIAKSFKTEGSGTTIMIPTVVTTNVTMITTISAKSGGEVTDDGGAEVIERGICWSINENPTVNDSHIAVGSGTGAFTASMNGLEANTTYHVRAYAINEAGTAYGLDKKFTTLSGSGNSFENGVLPGLFSISPTEKVYFSQGNLQYQASTNTWRFAEHQWDFVGGIVDLFGTELGNVFVDGIKCDNSLRSESYHGWIDLFGFGTNGIDNGFPCYQPWSTSINSEDYYCYDLNEGPGNADWGYNAICNGGNQLGLWRTLKKEEWAYLINDRCTITGIRYAFACLDGTEGLILLPDDWESSYYDLNEYNGFAINHYTNNIISIEEWNGLIEPHGAVFFPASGHLFQNRYDNYINGEEIHHGRYSSSTPGDNFSFHDNHIGLGWTTSAAGFPVRLVKNANP
jgi:hypothetical protein